MTTVPIPPDTTARYTCGECAAPVTSYVYAVLLADDTTTAILTQHRCEPCGHDAPLVMIPDQAITGTVP